MLSSSKGKNYKQRQTCPLPSLKILSETFIDPAEFSKVQVDFGLHLLISDAYEREKTEEVLSSCISTYS